MNKFPRPATATLHERVRSRKFWKEAECAFQGYIDFQNGILAVFCQQSARKQERITLHNLAFTWAFWKLLLRRQNKWLVWSHYKIR